MKSLYHFIMILVLACSCFVACQKEEYITSGEAKVIFSKDTLRFDTVFTQVGSATRFFKIRNPHEQAIKISKIYLAKGNASIFNLNIDGVAGDSQENIEIPAQDSIYVFAEVTINPNDKNNPFIIDEELIVETNGNRQRVILEAWGQNANYIPNNTAKGQVALMEQDQTWDDPKPYVVYGVLVVRGCRLTIPAGTRVYIHGGLAKPDKNTVYSDGMIYVDKGGSIETQGTKEKPVFFQGDRLEKDFENVPAQWNLMYFGAGTKADFSYTTIKNSRVGLYADSSSEMSLKYCQIYNTAGPGVLARQSTIRAENCLIHSNGGQSLWFLQGGTYNFAYSTIANIGASSVALEASNSLCLAEDNEGKCIRRINYPLNMLFRNSIIYSSQADAMSFLKIDAAPFNYRFENSIVRIDKFANKNQGFEDFYDNTKECINWKVGNKLFKKSEADNYRLDTLSIAEQKATPLSNFNVDLDGTPRDAQKPDIGAYEYKPK